MQSIDEINYFTEGGEKAKEKVKAFFEKIRLEKEPILLTTMVLSDGIGDLGMLSFLYYKLMSLKFCVYPIIFTDLPSNKPIILQQIPKAQVIAIDSNITADSVARILSRYMIGIFEKCFFIVYPFTFQFSLDSLISLLKISPEHILGIKEMGLVFDMKTGYLENGIGFGIPQWESVSIPEVESYLKWEPISLPEGEFYPQWFISSKSYLASVGARRDTKEDFFNRFQNYILMAQQLGISRLLFIVSKEVLSNVGYLKTTIVKVKDNYIVVKVHEITIVLSLPLPKPLLRAYLDYTEQVIFSGGEALFVESLGVNGKAASILCPRYSFQCMELANLLIKREKVEIVPVENPKNYQYFIDEKNTLLFLHERILLNVYNDFKPYDNQNPKLLSNASLQVIGFCLFSSCFQTFPIKFYKEYLPAYEQAQKIFIEIKEKLKAENWFSLAEKKVEEK